MKLSLTRTLWIAVVACSVLESVLAATLQVQVHDEQGKPLADAVVFLESRDAKQLFKPLANAEIAQVGRKFVPAVLVVSVGTPVSFPNRDTVRHHVYSFSPTKKFELKLFAGTPTTPVVFDKPGVAVLGCNIHDNMTAWVVVVETPYYGRTDAAGQALLNDVPPGNYHLRAWHSRLSTGTAVDQPLTLAAGGGAATVGLSGLAP